MTDTNAHEPGEAPLGLTPDHTIEEAVFQALGAASMCWEWPQFAGVFDSIRAQAIGEELMAWLRPPGADVRVTPNPAASTFPAARPVR